MGRYLSVKMLVLFVALFALVHSNAAEQATGSQPVQPAPSAVVTRGDIQRAVSANGQVLAKEIKIKSREGGLIQEFPLNLGRRVCKGELLAKFESDNEGRRMQRARISLDISRNRLDIMRLNFEIAKQSLETDKQKARAEVEASQMRLEQLQSILRRTQMLSEKSLISEEELEKAQMAVRQSELALTSAKLRLSELSTNELTLQLKQKEITIAQKSIEMEMLNLADAEQNLKNNSIFSPISGVISNVFVREGQAVSGGGEDLLEIMDLSHLYLDINIGKADIEGIREGMAAQVTTRQTDKSGHEGRVIFVSSKYLNSQEAMNFTVRVEILQKVEGALQPGMSTNVSIVVEERKNVLLLPLPAVRQEGEKYFVELVSADGAPQKREVRLGLRNHEMAEILSGLHEGDRVGTSRVRL